MSKNRNDDDDDELLPGGFKDLKPQLERLAVQTYIDLMTDGTVDPSVRKASADSVMKALGKAEPPKQAGGTQIVMNFGTGLKTALGGVNELQGLLTRNVTPGVDDGR